MDQMVELSYHTTIYREIITMDNLNYTIEHRKGQHLSSEERHDIEVHLRDGWSIYRIERTWAVRTTPSRTKSSAVPFCCTTEKLHATKPRRARKSTKRTGAAVQESIAVWKRHRS